MAYEALGGPPDTLRRLESQVLSAIESGVDARSAVGLRNAWLRRAAVLALPDNALDILASAEESPSPLYRAAAAYARGDTAGADSLLREGEDTRRRTGAQASDVSLDALLPEAWLRVQLGDTATAIVYLTQALRILYSVPPRHLLDPTRAASLVRAMAFLAELLHARADPDAAGWARAVTILWSDADPFLQPTVRRMSDIAAAGAPPR